MNTTMLHSFIYIRKVFVGLAILLATVYFAGCTKDPVTFTDYLEMEIDGVLKKCDSHIQASGTSPFPTQLLSISGNWDSNANESGAILIELYMFENKTGEYELTGPSLVSFWFTKKFSSGQVLTDTYYGNGTGTRLKITEITDRVIKGSFEFPVYMNTGPGTTAVKNITKGKFAIHRL